MKKRLIKPPLNDKEVLFIPPPEEIPSLLKAKNNLLIGTAHQPYFFHPGVSIKYLFLERLNSLSKKFLFLDIDRISLNLKLPEKTGGILKNRLLSFMDIPEILADYPNPALEAWEGLIRSIESCLLSAGEVLGESRLENYYRFKQILLKHISKSKLLKEVLARTYMEFSGITAQPLFVSDLLGSEQFNNFVWLICKRAEEFQQVFNSALSRFHDTFRFRFKNFPFPALKQGELPFWLLEGNLRKRCFQPDLDKGSVDKKLILPRAAALTLFLRLSALDIFIHGTSGANYEWINDRIIEEFFKKDPPRYIVASGTFFLNSENPELARRDFPYFLFNPDELKSCLELIP